LYYGHRGVTPVLVSIRQFLASGIAGFERSDVIYSLGLFDYVSDRMAVRYWPGSLISFYPMAVS
jgi:hypothetical protein